MSGWAWVPVRALVVFHDRQISRHGGAAGLRDLGPLEMGCNRAANAAACGGPDVFGIGAAHACGTRKAQAFIDGNKRTAFVVVFTFRRLNGHPLRPDPRDGVRMLEDHVPGRGV